MQHRDDAPPDLRLAIAQTAPVLRDLEANAARVADLAREASADILLTPELSLTGYDVGDAVHGLARRVRVGQPHGIPALADVPGRVVAGLIESAPRGPFNTAAVLGAGTVAFRHRKLYLPTYGMFDEGRWFGRGTGLQVWPVSAGWTAGILICEDLWHPALAWLLAARGIDLLLVQAAAPGRGVREGGEHGAFGSADVWDRIARTTAQVYGIYVALANRVGVEGGITFAGGSLIAAPDGSVPVRAGDHGEEVIAHVLERDALAAARRPYGHARDDDPHLILRELRRLVRETA